MLATVAAYYVMIQDISKDETYCRIASNVTPGCEQQNISGETFV